MTFCTHLFVTAVSQRVLHGIEHVLRDIDTAQTAKRPLECCQRAFDW